MPWFAWIPIVAIVMFTLAQIVSMTTGRALPWGSEDDEEIETLRKRVKELEEGGASRAPEEPRIPTKAEENLSAEDRWRLDMLEARLEDLEKQPGNGGASSSDDGGSTGSQDERDTRGRDGDRDRGADSDGEGDDSRPGATA